MADRPGITFSVYTSREVLSELTNIARIERRSVSLMASIMLEQGIERWCEQHPAEGRQEISVAVPCSSAS